MISLVWSAVETRVKGRRRWPHSSKQPTGAERERACAHLEEALRLTTDPRERAYLALAVAEAYASLFRWVDAWTSSNARFVRLGSGSINDCDPRCSGVAQ